MSCLENDKIFEAAWERAQEEGFDDVAIIGRLELEDAFEYVMTGKLPQYLLYE